MRHVEIESYLNVKNKRNPLSSVDVQQNGAHLRAVIEGKLASNESHPPSPGSSTPDSAIGHDDDVFSLSTKETGTITDVSNNADLPEVEILSLIEEQIPKYRLRTDTITDFQGCSNVDWIQTPLVPLDEDIDLTHDQLKGYFSYLLQCGERVSQMTKTYNDIEAVSRLLEEKERDLELAATIGHALLEKNRDIKEKNENLDEDLRIATEKVYQLKHELALKDELLRVYTEESEENDTPHIATSPLNSTNSNVDALQKKVTYLEEDNLTLRSQFDKLHSENYSLEEKEQKLFGDYVEQLTDVIKHRDFLSEELSKRIEEVCIQKEEITRQLAQIVDAQSKIKVLMVEKVELQHHLEASQTSQKKLTKELSLLKDRYDELFEMLEEAQEELRVLRKKQRPGASKQYMSSSLSIPSDSLASELENSMRADFDYPTGYSPQDRRMHNWKIFETARAAKRAARRVDVCRRPRSVAPISTSSFYQSGAESGNESISQSLRSSFYLSDGESAVSDGYSGDLDSVCGSVKNLGRPGIPGSNDLETAVRRLAIRRASELNEEDFREMEKRRQGKSQSMEPHGSPSPSNSEMADSTLSTGSGGRSSNSYNINIMGGNNNPYFRIPEKLQIIKPLEGSVTLRQWQQLATPHLGGIFEDRPGVQIKGERKLEMEEECYSLSDFEEDEECQASPGKNFVESPSIFTYTDSKVRHPSHSPRSVSSKMNMSTETTSSSNTKPSVVLKNRGTPTYSMSLGLASILDERDLLSPTRTTSKAVQPNHPGKNPARFPSIVSDTQFDVSKCKVTVTHSPSVTTTCITTVTSSGIQQASSPSEQLFGVLKNTGTSFYEYFTGMQWSKSVPPLPSSAISSSSCSVTSCVTVNVTSRVSSTSAPHELTTSQS